MQNSKLVGIMQNRNRHRQVHRVCINLLSSPLNRHFNEKVTDTVSRKVRFDVWELFCDRFPDTEEQTSLEMKIPGTDTVYKTSLRYYSGVWYGIMNSPSTEGIL